MSFYNNSVTPDFLHKTLRARTAVRSRRTAADGLCVILWGTPTAVRRSRTAVRVRIRLFVDASGGYMLCAGGLQTLR